MVMRNFAQNLEKIDSPADVRTLVLAVQNLSLARSIQEISDIVTNSARSLADADGVTFVLSEGDYCHYFHEDAIEPLWKGNKFLKSECISGWVMDNRQAAVIDDIAVDERIPLSLYNQTFVKSLVMLPVRVQEPMASIGIYWAESHKSSSVEVNLLQALADSTATAMENVQVYEELEERVRLRTVELQRKHDELQQALDKIQNLEMIVRKCAWSDRYELDGKWMSVEDYLRQRFGMVISHGLSDEALSHLKDELLTQGKASSGENDVNNLSARAANSHPKGQRKSER